MPFKSIKEKINNLASGEILGETEEEREEREKKERSERKTEREREQSAPIPKTKKTREPKKKKEKKTPVENFFKRKSNLELEQDEELKSETQPKEIKEKIKLKDSVDGYEDVLAILGIKEDLNLDLDFESGDLDYIEFSQTTPLGFDFDEVTDFISRMKYILNKYENAAKQRNKEVIILASEIKKVEQRMIEQNQAKEMEKMIGGMTEEERLIEENMDLKVELNKLRAQQSSIKGGVDNKVIKELEKQIQALRSENEVLTLKMMNGNKSQDSSNQHKGLPSIDENNSNYDKLPPMNLGALPEIPSKSMSDITDIEGEEFLETLMKMGEPKKKDTVEKMLDDIGGDY